MDNKDRGIVMLSLPKIFIVIICSLLFSVIHIEAGQCQATTKKGSQCKRQAQAGSIYCWQHGEKTQTTTSKEIKTDTVKKENSPLQEFVSTQCQATTKKGAQCKRKAKAGSKYCWQHEK